MDSITYINLEYVFNKILEFFRYLFGGVSGSGSGSGSDVASADGGISFFRFLLFALSVFFIFIIVYVIIRMFEIRKKEHHYLEEEIAEYAHHQAMREHEAASKRGSEFKNEKWTIVLEHLFSQNEGDWRLAIIEADAMLDALLDQLGFKGENLGERLKSAKDSDFRLLPTAWEVHIIRNKIAHEGMDFHISEHEAKRVVALYESIFREYDYI